MHDARDAEDKRLLDEKNYGQLVANYVHQIYERCYVRLRESDAADDAAHTIIERLLRELKRGKRYSVPFRVVVWKITGWELDGFYAGNKRDDELPENWDEQAPDEFDEWERAHDLLVLFEDLPDGDREVAEAIYRDGLTPAQAAERLNKKPNAVYQALHRAHKRLAEKLVA